MLNPVIVNIIICPRCGGDHSEITLRPFTTPIGVLSPQVLRWALCPTNGEPILQSAEKPVDTSRPYAKRIS